MLLEIFFGGDCGWWDFLRGWELGIWVISERVMNGEGPPSENGQAKKPSFLNTRGLCI